jgi:hypothetical protein
MCYTRRDQSLEREARRVTEKRRRRREREKKPPSEKIKEIVVGTGR